MPEPFERVVFHEYFYKRLSELEDEVFGVVSAMRTKKGLLILCDRLRALEVEKQVLMRVYEDLRLLF